MKDGVGPWGWVEHNGKDYGKQIVVDKPNNLHLVIYFRVSNFGENDSWETLIEGTKYDPTLPLGVNLTYYVGDQGKGSHICYKRLPEGVVALNGQSCIHGSFQMRLSSKSNASNALTVHAKQADPKKVWDAVSLVTTVQDAENQGCSKGNNFASVEYNFNDDFYIATLYSKGTCKRVESRDFKEASTKFHRQFHKTFPSLLTQQRDLYAMCKFALSNMLGSISYDTIHHVSYI